MAILSCADMKPIETARGLSYYRMTGRSGTIGNRDDGMSRAKLLNLIQLPTQVRFYYPDVSVVCRPNLQTDSFQDEPVVLFEVPSRGIRCIDEGEKKDAYLVIPSPSIYVLIEPDSPAVVVFRRSGGGLVREVYEGLDAVLPLSKAPDALPVSSMKDRLGNRFGK